MKKFCLFGLALLLALGACNLPQFTPTQPNPTTAATVAATSASPSPAPGETRAPSPPLTSIFMIDAQNGWGQTTDAILRTTNGGAQWYPVTPPGAAPPLDIARMFFLDANTGWVLAPGADFNSGSLFRTQDAGQTWTSSAVPFGPSQMQFLDPQNGFVLIGRGAGAGSSAVDVGQTVDGGQSWELVFTMEPGKPETPGELPFHGNKNGLAFRDLSNGWVTGTEPREGYTWLYVTQDGGKTWQHQDLTLPTGLESSMLSIDPPRFYSALDGVLPVTLFSTTQFKGFYITHDGGATWMVTTPVQNSGLYDLVSMNDFFVWDGATLDVSHDGGGSWTSMTSNLNLSQIISALDFVDATHGWALSIDVNQQRSFYQTSDGGITWTKVDG